MTSSRLLAASLTGTERSKNETGADGQPGSEDELSLIGHDFVGEFFWSSTHSGTLLDFEHLELRSDGTYFAKVEATLLNAGVLSFGSPCTLPEEGRWNAYKVSGQTRLRVRPTTSRARVYIATMVSGHLSLARRGKRTMLFLGDRLSLSEDDSDVWTPAGGSYMDDDPSDDDIITTCA